MIDCVDYKDETEDIIRKFQRKEDFVYYTSGSTGKPKKIVHSYELMRLVAEENCGYNNYTNNDYIVNMSLPAASIGYPVLSVLPALMTNCNLKVIAFNPYEYLDEIQNATHAFILPAVYRVLKKTDKWKNFDFTNDSYKYYDFITRNMIIPSSDINNIYLIKFILRITEWKKENLKMRNY